LIEPPHEVTFIAIERVSSGDLVVTRRAESVAQASPPVDRLPELSPANQTWRYSGAAWNEIPAD
jgi:hypothetical protein